MEFLKQIIKNILSSTPILKKFIIWQGKKRSNLIALTFDDGPIPQNTEQLLSTLKKSQTPVTFFLLGKQIHKYPEITRQIFNEGHLIANHTYSHAQFDKLSNDEALREIERCFTEIKKFLGILPNKYFRAPKGDIRWRLLYSLFIRGIKLVFWTVDPKDYLLKNAQKINETLTNFNYRGGEIILLHDYVPETIDMISGFIETKKSQGFKFVTLDKIVK